MFCVYWVVTFIRLYIWYLVEVKTGKYLTLLDDIMFSTQSNEVI